MQALKLPAGSGWRWVVGGWRLFRSQPFSFTALLIFFWLLLLCTGALVEWVTQAIGAVAPPALVEMIAVIGTLLVAVLTPVLAIGFLQACRLADSGLPIHPVLLFAAFRAGRRTLVRLLILGSIQIFVLILIVLLTGGTSALRGEGATTEAATATSTASSVATPSAGTTAPAANQPVKKDAQPPSVSGAPTEAEKAALVHAMKEKLLYFVLYMPVTLVMWYAPMLVAWHELPPGKALFFSLVAVWRNRAPFIIYGLGWLAILILMTMGVATLSLLLGTNAFVAILAVPLAMVLMTCMYCSVYPSYATVFVDSTAAPVVTEDEPTSS